MSGQLDGLYNLIFWMLIVLIINYISDAFYSYFLRKTGQSAIFDIREVLFERILSFPQSYFDKVPSGVTLARLTSDLEAIGESFVLGIFVSRHHGVRAFHGLTVEGDAAEDFPGERHVACDRHDSRNDDARR